MGYLNILIKNYSLQFNHLIIFYYYTKYNLTRNIIQMVEPVLVSYVAFGIKENKWNHQFGFFSSLLL